jgi:23S rRNA (uridine2552-2'-O)-methyltransferase
MAKNKFNQSWLHDHINDPYVKMAQREGYRARAAYKLKEIDDQDKLIQPGQVIVDLGAAPGSWSQYARNKLAASPRERRPDRRRRGGDRHPADGAGGRRNLYPGRLPGRRGVPSARTGGARCVWRLPNRPCYLRYGPQLVGVASADAARIEYLCDLALEFAQAHLKPEGSLLVKCFHGSGYSQIVEKFKRQFKVVASRKPKASRDKSSETFILGRYLKSVD